jgi:hypothetical protein
MARTDVPKDPLSPRERHVLQLRIRETAGLVRYAIRQGVINL